MEKKMLIEKVRECKSGIDMLRMKDDILSHLEDGKKKTKKEMKMEGDEE